MVFGISVHDTHVVNTVSPIFPEVMDQEVSFLFQGPWRWRVVPVGRTCGPGYLILRPIHGATFKYEGVIAHERGVECFSGQVYDPVPELVMTRRNEDAPLAIKGMTYLEFGVVDVTVLVEVWGI